MVQITMTRSSKQTPLRIGIIGAGFSGTALAASIHHLSHLPVEIYLFEKRGKFGAGNAYSTPYPFHLLNVRARDMSAFEEKKGHFVDWLNAHPSTSSYLETGKPVGDQFVSRSLYGQYLQSLLQSIQQDTSSQTRLFLEAHEVVDAMPGNNAVSLILDDQRSIEVDKVILATGTNPCSSLKLQIPADTNYIGNPWQYTAIQQIGVHDSVLIIGTGLSMIDTVLTLHHQGHQGKINAISRHGLMPLPHADASSSSHHSSESLPDSLRNMTKRMRKDAQLHTSTKGDWRDVINSVRPHIPAIWQSLNKNDKNRFIRHVLPYWNVHRHRVNQRISEQLQTLIAQQQLHIHSGHINEFEKNSAQIKMRHSSDRKRIAFTWLINCMGPSLYVRAAQQPLIQSLISKQLIKLNELGIGFTTTNSGALLSHAGDVSSVFYTLGAPAKGTFWESDAVPEIRKQCHELSKTLLSHVN